MRNVKLMVIDDNREFCMLVKEYTKMLDEVEFCGAAFDGISALSLIREKKPDVILLDSIMPQLDGIGVMKHLKNFEKKLRPKVVAVTASLTNFYVSEMHDLGASYIISKNTDISDMLDRCIMVYKTSVKNENSYSEDAENLITSAVCSVGIPAKLKGYSYLRTSIKMTIENPDIIHSVTKQLYPAVAEIYNTTPSNVERNIRSAVEAAWVKGDKQALIQIFGTNLDFSKPKPTNSEFIAMFADKLRIKLKNRGV